MKTLTLTFTLVMLAVVPARTDAQQRIGGLALIGGGALMTLASGTCDIDRVSAELTGSLSDGLLSYSLSNPRATGGGPWPGGECGFTVDFRAQGNYTRTIYQDATLTDAQLREVPGLAGDVNRLRSDMRTRNPAMLYGGIAAIAGGVVLAILPGGSDTPALDVQAGPHGVRLSRTFGF